MNQTVNVPDPEGPPVRVVPSLDEVITIVVDVLVVCAWAAAAGSAVFLVLASGVFGRTQGATRSMQLRWVEREQQVEQAVREETIPDGGEKQ